MVIGDKGDTIGVHPRFGEDTYFRGPSDCLPRSKGNSEAFNSDLLLITIPLK